MPQDSTILRNWKQGERIAIWSVPIAEPRQPLEVLQNRGDQDCTAKHWRHRKIKTLERVAFFQAGWFKIVQLDSAPRDRDAKEVDRYSARKALGSWPKVIQNKLR